MEFYHITVVYLPNLYLRLQRVLEFKGNYPDEQQVPLQGNAAYPINERVDLCLPFAMYMYEPYGSRLN